MNSFNFEWCGKWRDKNIQIGTVFEFYHFHFWWAPIKITLSVKRAAQDRVQFEPFSRKVINLLWNREQRRSSVHCQFVMVCSHWLDRVWNANVSTCLHAYAGWWFKDRPEERLNFDYARTNHIMSNITITWSWNCDLRSVEAWVGGLEAEHDRSYDFY